MSSPTDSMWSIADTETHILKRNVSQHILLQEWPDLMIRIQILLVANGDTTTEFQGLKASMPKLNDPLFKKKKRLVLKRQQKLASSCSPDP